MTKEPETPLEIEDLAVGEGPVEKTIDDGESLPETGNALAGDETGTDLPSVQGIAGRMANEKNGKYVRYGKGSVINGRDRYFATK